MKSAMEVGTKMKSAMELATEVEEANEMKTVMEVPTEWTCEEAEMICVMAVATQVKSTVNENYAPKMKFTLESRSGKLSEICAGVSTRTKYEMKSVI